MTYTGGSWRSWWAAIALAMVLAGGGSLAAQEGEEAAVVEPVEAAPLDEVEMTGDVDDFVHWRLKGGGEIVGPLVKETPREVYIDIGPRIIEIPIEGIISRLALSQVTESDSRAPVGLGSGTFDPETGSIVFRSRDEAGQILTQQEILEQVRRSVVLVSNPGGLGTGWFIDEGGRLVTNHHVVGRELYQTVTVFVQRGNQWERRRIDNCRVEAFSSLYDIAVVQLNMERAAELGVDVHPLRIAPPGALEAGDVVHAIGNPGMGGMVLEHTISEGIVSSLARNFGDVIYLQTTAAVNPGNSGGPLVNRQGEVVGLVTLKAIFQEGVAFALPVEFIHQFLNYSNAYAVSDTSRSTGFRYHRPQ